MSKAVDRAYQKIRAGILDGTLMPDARLKEIELVDFCGVSRTPVREALRRLAADELVSIQSNHGAQVRSWSEDDFDDLFALRALLEGYAAQRAAHRITEAGIRRLEIALEQMRDILAQDLPEEEKVTEFLRLNRAVHEPIWEAAGSKPLMRIMANLVEQALMVHTVQFFSLDRIAASHHDHEDLLRALKSRDGSWAGSIMANHIHAARDALRLGRQVVPDVPEAVFERKELA